MEFLLAGRASKLRLSTESTDSYGCGNLKQQHAEHELQNGLFNLAACTPSTFAVCPEGLHKGDVRKAAEQTKSS